MKWGKQWPMNLFHSLSFPLSITHNDCMQHIHSSLIGLSFSRHFVYFRYFIFSMLSISFVFSTNIYVRHFAPIEEKCIELVCCRFGHRSTRITGNKRKSVLRAKWNNEMRNVPWRKGSAALFWLVDADRFICFDWMGCIVARIYNKRVIWIQWSGVASICGSNGWPSRPVRWINIFFLFRPAQVKATDSERKGDQIERK